MIEFAMKSAGNISIYDLTNQNSVKVVWEVRSEASHPAELENSSLFQHIESNKFQIMSRQGDSSRTDQWLVIRAMD